MKTKIKNYSSQFIKEIIPVIAGILIALFIDNWNNERKDKIYIDQIFSTIKSELTETKEDIKSTIPRQKTLIDSLEFYSDKENIVILDIVKKAGGFYLPNIKMNAWRSVTNAKIDLIDYKKLTALSDIEEQKETLKNKSDYLMTFLYSNFYETEKSKKETLKMILLDIIQTEQSLQGNIEYLLDEK